MTGTRRIVVFGFDVNEVSQIRRIRALRDLGHDVQSFTMRRRNMNDGFEPDWPNTHLYDTANEQILKRAFVVAGSILKMTRHREALRQADVIVARNLDMLAIAWAARRMAGARGALVYECLDIHGAMTGSGSKSKAMRRVERLLLSDVDLLAVSSPGFIRHYFEPMQGFTGAWELLENKLVDNGHLPDRPRDATLPAGPRRLGWVGTIRCAPSLDILLETARRMGDGLELHISGVVHRHVLPDFDARIAAMANVTYHGAYRYPEDLVDIYDRTDIVWAQDLWQRGTNSDWLLPNRIYEAPWAGCPCIAVEGTETGRRVASDGLGEVIASPDADALAACLRGLSDDILTTQRQALLDRPASDFVQTGADLSRVIDRATEATR